MRLGLISDAHGNIAGFDAAVRLLAAAGADRYIFLGDAIGYIPDVSVVRRILEMQLSWIAGNHEAMLEDGADDGVVDAYRLTETRGKLSAVEVQAIRSLPRQLEFECNDTRCLFVHGSPRNPTRGYIYPDSDLSEVGGLQFDAVFMGHTHRPFVRTHDGTLFVNVGSCGLPRDAAALGCACLFDTATRRAEIMRFSLAAAACDIIASHAVAAPVRSLLERAIERG